MFNELKNRGVKDILIACHDNLSGFSNALETVFPKTENHCSGKHDNKIGSTYLPARYHSQKDVSIDRIGQHLENSIKCYQTSHVFRTSSSQVIPHQHHGNTSGQTH